MGSKIMEGVNGSNGDFTESRHLASVLLSSSTLERKAALRVLQQMIPTAELPKQPLEDVIQTLFNTYPLYRDRGSRRAVQDCLEAILAVPSSSRYVSVLVGLVREEASKTGIASSNIFVLVEWCSLLVQHCGEYEDTWLRYGSDLVDALARLLEACVSSGTRSSVKKSALVVARRAFRKIFRAADSGESAIRRIVQQLSAKGQTLGFKNAVLLGVVAGVCARLPTRTRVLEDVKGQYLSFWVREVIGSRFAVPPHIAGAFRDFFARFTVLQDLQMEIVPALEKALLRAPEVVLNSLIAPMVCSLPSDIDLAETLAKRLLKPLLSNLKSTNADIRNGAVTSFKAVAERCYDQKMLEQIIDEILTPLRTSKLQTAEQRVLYSRLLTLITPVRSRIAAICDGLSPLLSKEPNEAALGAEAAALAHHFELLVIDDLGESKTATSAFVNGLSDKRMPVQKAWALRAGDVLRLVNQQSVQQASSVVFIEAVLPKLISLFNETVINPISAAQTGVVAAGYVVTALFPLIEANTKDKPLQTLIRKARVYEQALVFTPKPSFLLNYKVYSKLSTEEDLSWAIRAAAACSPHLLQKETTLAAGEAWAQLFLYLITASHIPFAIQNEALETLSETYLVNPNAVQKFLIGGLWTWLRSTEVMDRDTATYAAQNSKDSLYLAIRAICPRSETRQSKKHALAEDIIQDQLLDLLILCRPEILPRAHWIEMCLRVEQDPGALVRAQPQQAIDRVNQALSNAEQWAATPAFERAAYRAIAELAFVAPETVTPLVVEQIRVDLSIEDLRSCSSTDIAIARSSADTPFIDVLSKKSQNHIVDKSTRDYDTLKWEEEVRKQLAQKKGQQKKLSADDQAKVNTQLAKEAKIRAEVIQIENRIRRGIGVIQGLVLGPPTDAEAWMGPSLKALHDAIYEGVGALVDNLASEVYIICANLVSARLGSLRPFIGIATLRALGTAHISNELEQEPLGELILRILYRLRLASEQRPFDSVSLSYILPLIFIILRHQGSGSSSADEAEEQVTLALEILSFHAEEFSHKTLPRNEVLSTLIRSMQEYSQHYKLIKDCLQDVCRSLAPTMSTSETATLLDGVIVSQIPVRTAVLQSIEAEVDLTDLDFCEEIWIASHDDVEEVAEIGRAIWQENALEVQSTDATKILPFLASNDRQLRRAASRALADCIAQNSTVFSSILEILKEQYREKAKPKAPEKDAYGMPKKTDLKDPWEARSGITMAFKDMALLFKADELVPFFIFLIDDNALGDRHPLVRDEMIESASAIIAAHGSERLEELMTMFEKALESSGDGPGNADLVNEAVVILYGAVAHHLRAGDERVPKVVRKLLMTLSTPSETVQYAVAGCLPPLIRTSNEKTSEYIQQVLDQLLQSKKYAARRGAAYGLAGIVRGKGLSALREYRIMSTLRGALESKKDQNQRQGVLFAYELLSLILGRLFEPYVIQIVPQLLAGFGDSSADVREASLDAAKTCFASLTSFGVKQILPTLLEGLEEQQWRSKKGACDLLGAMAYLDPQQLALSLPEIIPPLTNILSDSHKEVRAAANRSLQRFGEVISNPEVKGLVSILLKALSDPTKYTDDALDSLIKVSFVHYLDAPSLALVVRILERGLGDRSATKRKSAQIIGSLAHLTERKDLISHLPILVTGLKVAAVDPVPTTRATASKALGSLVGKLGEDALPDLIPGLMSTLKSETGAGDRLGSAQALSEVLAGLGTGRLEETLPTILQNVSSSKPTIREGFMSLFIFLPACFGNSFANYLSKIIPPILSGLADEIESIRETSLRAGRLLVKNFATRAIDLLLPELDRGLANDSYRIRLSSVELVGDLLFNLTGISGKNEQEEEEEEGATEAGQSLLEVLGEDKRNKILSSLYICRCDTSGLVRTAAINVWKALVATPRTLKELIPTLVQLIVRRLASSNLEQKVIAGNALGELIRKAGEGVLASLLPSLEEGLQSSTDNDNKQGICIALREIISSASPEGLEDYEKTLTTVVRTALVDPSDEVREAAAEAFDSLQKAFGKKAVDQVLPYLLALLRTEDGADTALSALLTLLTDNTRSSIILPNLISTLLTPPITAFNAKAIASLSQVAGPGMNRRLPTILNALMDNLILCKDDALRSELASAFDSILLSIDEFDGLNTTMSVMLALVKHDDHRKRALADMHLSKFFANSELDFSRYNQDLIRVLLISFDDRDSEVVKAAWTALSELTKQLRKEEMESLVTSTRQVVQQIGVAGSNLPGFCLPKGINAVLPIFLQGLMNGTAEQRTQSALAISDVIDRTSVDVLKGFVTQITGPLIRVVSERSVDVKCAILLALNNLLEKIPTYLKPFLPQLQRTFAKSLADTSSELLRSRAAKALGTLITLTPRIDPLVAELVAGTKTDDPGVRNAMLKALYEVVSKAGANMSDVSRNSILGLTDSLSADADDSMAIVNARLLGALVKNLPTPAATILIKNRVLTTHFTNASILNLNATLLESPASLIDSFSQETPSIIRQGISHKNPFISSSSVLACGKYLLAPSPPPPSLTTPLIASLATSIPPTSPYPDTRRLSLVVIRTLTRSPHGATLLQPSLPLLAPPIFASVRDPIIPIKLAAEQAFLALFDVVEHDSAIFDRYMASEDGGGALSQQVKRGMADYFKRVALRLGAQARERREAEGGQGGLGLEGDEVEDEREVWSVGRVELGEGVFASD